MTFKKIVRALEHGMEERRFGIRLAAPFFFLLTALLRCYLETHVIAARSYFSYFVALHHVLWYLSTILAVISITHLILKVAVEKLLWLMYGAVLLLIPAAMAMIQGKPLLIDYLTGSFSQIITHILTFYFTYQQNLPLRAEIIVIFAGMTGVGYLYSRSWWRGLALGAAVYLIGNLLAISWLGTSPTSKSVFVVHSTLLNHPFLAVVFAHILTLVSAVLASRAGLIRGGSRPFLLSAIAAVAVAGVYMAVMAQSGWFSHPIDIVLTSLPIWSTAFAATLWRNSEPASLSRWFWVVVLTLLFFQWAVLGPIYFHAGVAKPLTVREFWTLPQRPF
ncbi:MAG: hypothetical protein LLG97_12180 [Deltaproteobacteria bacterium]|nr:hypothetical protein [Deltaproteobacteria bacterium]